MGDHVVVGSTLKLMRGSAEVVGSVPPDAATLERAVSLAGANTSRFGLDVGAMATFGIVHVGVSLKNVTEPAFDTGGPERLTLDRRARLGVALRPQVGGAVSALVVAVDADLTTTTGALGDERHLAAGVEAWTLRRRLALRGGVRANVAGGHWTAGSAGASVALRSGLSLDAQLTRGEARAPRSWGVGARVTF